MNDHLISRSRFLDALVLDADNKTDLIQVHQALEKAVISPDEVRGVGEITGDDACPSCGCWIPTDDAHDAIFKNEVKFCYYCGMRLRMKGAEDGTTDN